MATLDEVLDEVTEAALGASRALVAIAVRSLGERVSDLTLVQYRCLVVLSEQGPTPTTALSVLVGVHQSTVTRATDHLLGRGLATKQRDLEDRRRTVVALTAAGAGVVADVMAARRQILHHVLAHLPPGDAERTTEAFRAFTRAAAQVPGDLGGSADAL